MVALPLAIEEEQPEEHHTQLAVSLLRQAIVLLQGGAETDGIVRAQADVLVNLIKPRRKKVIKDKWETHPPWLQLAFSFDPELVVNVNIRVRGQRYVAAAVSPVFADSQW